MLLKESLPPALRNNYLLHNSGTFGDRPLMPKTVDNEHQSWRSCQAPKHAAADEMVKLVITHAVITGGHRLTALALAIAGADQPCHIGMAHPPARTMPKRLHERLKPAIKLFGPIPSRAHHGQPRQCRPPMNHSKADGNPKNDRVNETCQSSANALNLADRGGDGNLA